MAETTAIAAVSILYTVKKSKIIPNSSYLNSACDSYDI